MTKIKTKLIELSIRDYILKRNKGQKDIKVAMIDAFITVRRNKKMEKFQVQLPLDDQIELKTNILDLVAQAIRLKFPEDFKNAA